MSRTDTLSAWVARGWRGCSPLATSLIRVLLLACVGSSLGVAAAEDEFPQFRRAVGTFSFSPLASNGPSGKLTIRFDTASERLVLKGTLGAHSLDLEAQASGESWEFVPRQGVSQALAGNPPPVLVLKEVPHDPWRFSLQGQLDGILVRQRTFPPQLIQEARRLWAGNVGANGSTRNCIEIMSHVLDTALYPQRELTVRGQVSRFMQVNSALTEPAVKIEFLDEDGRVSGVTRPDVPARSLWGELLAQTGQDPGWFAFGLSVLDGYHAVTLLVDNSDPARPRVYWCDQVYNTGRKTIGAAPGWFELTPEVVKNDQAYVRGQIPDSWEPEEVATLETELTIEGRLQAAKVTGKVGSVAPLDYWLTKATWAYYDQLLGKKIRAKTATAIWLLRPQLP